MPRRSMSSDGLSDRGAERGVRLELRAHRRLDDDRSGWDWVFGLSRLDTIIDRGRGARDTMGYDDDRH